MENLFKLKDINLLLNINIKKRLKSLAMLDAMLCPEWEYRYFSFNNSWDKDESMASMRDGEGNEYFILFKNENIIGKIFEKKHSLSDLQREEIFKKIPKTLKSFFGEVAFSLEDTTFLFWKEQEAEKWSSFPLKKEIPYLGFLYTSELYINWAKEYYEVNFDEKTIQEIFNYSPLTEERVQKLNKTLCLDDLKEDIKEIAYCPVQPSKRTSPIKND